MNEKLKGIEYSDWRDKVQYSVASASAAAGIGMGFLAFLTSGHIGGDILGYIGECFTLTGGIFGVTLYIKNKTKTAAEYIVGVIKDQMNNVQNDIDVDKTQL